MLAAGISVGWCLRNVEVDTPLALSDSEHPEETAPRLIRAKPSESAGEVRVLGLSESGLLRNLKELKDWAEREPEEALAWIETEGLLALPAQREAVLGGLMDAGRGDEARERIEAIAEVSLRHLCRESMLVAWAESDPASAFNYGNEFALFRSAEGIRSLFGQWAVRDPEAAGEAWKRLPNAAQRLEALASIASSMGQNDSQAALAWADGLPEGRDRDLATELAWAGWAKKDPLAVLREGVALEPRFQRGVMQNAIAELTRRDPDQARRLAADVQDPVLKDAMLFAVGEELAARNPEMAAEVSMDLNVGTEESTLTMNTMRAWLHGDPDQAMEWAASLPENRKADALHAAFFQLSDVDPRKAAGILAMEGAPESLGEQTELIGRGFAEQDPAAAVEWAGQLADHRRLDAMRGIVAGVARENPEEALRILDEQSPEMRGDLVESLAGGWAQRDPETALSWAAELEGGDRTRATSKIVGLLAIADPGKAAEAVSTWIDDSEGEPCSGLEQGYTHPGVLAVGEIARHWDPESMGDAVAWTSKFPEGALRTEAVATVFEQWAKSSPTALANHLQAMPAGRDRDEGAYQLSTAMARADIGAATAWAASLSHPDARAAAARFFMEAARDKSQAFDHITSSGLLGAEETHALFETP